MIDRDLLGTPLIDLGRKLRAGATTVPALVEACLAVEARTRTLNAYAEVYAQDARALAGAAQSLLDHGYDLGPLHGLPIALKANIAVRGRPMTAGSRILASTVADEDAVVARRLKGAGAILLGFTNMHEFAWGGTTANPHYGQTRNAWDPERIPAGSSGGSGTAVAAGSALAALGTDTGGSVRLPASMNGVTGLRPSVGRVGVDGIFPLAVSMDTVGPIARSSADCALLFQAMIGQEPDAAALARLESGLQRPLEGTRIGLIAGYATEGVQPDIARAFEAAVAVLERAGTRVIRLAFEGLDFAVDAQVIVDAAEPSTVHDAWIDARPEDYGADVRTLLVAGRAFSATEYLHAQRYRTFLRRQFDQALAEVDVILTPTLPFTAPRIGADTVMIGDVEENTLTGNMRFTSLPSLTALPALSFPIGFDRDGLPIGAQLIGGHAAEMTVLRFAHRFQMTTDHHRRWPAMLGASPVPNSAGV